MVPLAAPVVEVLRRHLAGLPTTGPLVANRRFPGEHLTREAVSRLLSVHLRGAGVGDTGHALRHTFATELLKAGRGANLYAVSKALGHSSTEVTEQVYVSSYLGDLAALAALLPDPRSRPAQTANDEPAALAGTGGGRDA